MNPLSATHSASLARDPCKKLVLFHRDFRAFTGGHLKVWDYFNHVASSPAHEPRIAFSRESRWDSTNPWFGSTSYITIWEPEKADVLFFAGTDWRVLPVSERENFRNPVINLLQHVRHGEGRSELRGFLKNRAIRICASDAIADAINATREVNGPVFVIPYGIDLAVGSEQSPSPQRRVDVLIGGLKAPELARGVYAAVARDDRRVECLTDWIPRAEYLERLKEAKIAIVLPRPSEGFYLPAIEAMACGAIVVCPDCIGNRDFCHDGVNCFRPRHKLDKIVSAAAAALRQTEPERARMQEHANATASQHSMEIERANFLRILARAEELW